MRLVIFTEEESMSATLRILLPRLGLAEDRFLIVTFQGVTDLELSLPRKLRKWRDPEARFLILRDNDRGDCRARKARLMGIVTKANREARTKVRIVVQQLEAWFLGDITALENAGILAPGSRPAAVRKAPEGHARPVEVLKRLEPAYQKTNGARRIAPHLDLTDNRASSFVNTIAAIRELSGINGA